MNKWLWRILIWVMILAVGTCMGTLYKADYDRSLIGEPNIKE